MENKYQNKHNEDAEKTNLEQQSDIEVNDVIADNDNCPSTPDEDIEEEIDLQSKLEQTTAELEKEKKEYLFLMAEFDNFRKRTIKEKSELIKNGGENALRGLLPIIDDFERSLQAINESSDPSSIKEGVELIYNKFIKYLQQNGVQVINTEAGTDFDADMHEAVTMFPAPDTSQKGKIIDTVQKGYMLHDKVIRHAKVVVGQ